MSPPAVDSSILRAGTARAPPRKHNSTQVPFTPSQQKAISARGNVLVVAGAGTGKTSTLVERCIHSLEASPPASIDEILMVTFTEAAAAEMRQRIRARLEEQARNQPESPRWQ